MTRFPPPPPGAERRVHARHDVLVSVEVAHDDTVAIGSLVNVSHGGAFIEVPDAEPIPVGVRVRLHIVDGSADLAQDARVVRVSAGVPSGFAVTWIEPGPVLAAVVDQLVKGGGTA